MLVAPSGKNAALVLGSGDRSRDLFDQRDAERTQLPCGSRRDVFVGDAPAEELAVDGVRRVGEYADSGGHAGGDEIGRLQRSGAPGVARHHDDVGRSDGVLDDQCPPEASQDGPSEENGRQRHGQDRQ